MMIKKLGVEYSRRLHAPKSNAQPAGQSSPVQKVAADLKCNPYYTEHCELFWKMSQREKETELLTHIVYNVANPQFLRHHRLKQRHSLRLTEVHRGQYQ